MRRSSLALTTALLSIIGALGCADHQSPTAPAGPPSGPALSVERGQAPYGAGFTDGQLIVFVGLTAEDLTSGFCTGTAFDVDTVNQLLVTRPDGSTKLQQKGAVNVVVVELAAFEASFCEEPSAVPTYTGTARFLYNDSDVDLSGAGADASMVHVVGTVTDQNGQEYHLVAIDQAVVAPEFTSTDDFEFRHGVIKIKLTPLGR